MVHWGLYSVPAFDSVASARLRRIQNGSEWYLARLQGRASGDAATRSYHATHFGANTPYASFARAFTADTFRASLLPLASPGDKPCGDAPTETKEEDKKSGEGGGAGGADQWMRVFREAGASYVVLTAKHHDGFCLWPTRTKNAHVLSKDCAAQLDLVGAFCQAARRHGLRVGLYYSWSEFGVPCTRTYLEDVVRPQVRELLAYAPDLLWFDGDWECRTKLAQQTLDECCALTRRRLPGVLINDRVGHKAAREADPRWLPAKTGYYRVYGDRALPSEAPGVPWEHVNTIGLSWGRNRQQRPPDYKTAAQLAALHAAVAKLGGRFLINVGPEPDGSLCPDEARCLASFGALLRASPSPLGSISTPSLASPQSSSTPAPFSEPTSSAASV